MPPPPILRKSPPTCYRRILAIYIGQNDVDMTVTLTFLEKRAAFMLVLFSFSSKIFQNWQAALAFFCYKNDKKSAKFNFFQKYTLLMVVLLLPFFTKTYRSHTLFWSKYAQKPIFKILFSLSHVFLLKTEKM